MNYLSQNGLDLYDSLLKTELGELNDSIDTVASEKADAIIEAADGSVVSFPDGGDDLPLKALTVFVKPTQAGSGDPSPTNVRQISGRTGVNGLITGKNLSPTASVTNCTWATNIKNATGNGKELFDRLNALPPGTYTLSWKMTVKSVSDAYTSSTATAITNRIAISNSAMTEITNGAGDEITRAQAIAGYSRKGTITFEITEAAVGNFTNFYIYGLGRDSATEGAPNGALGSADFFDFQLEHSSAATNYELYAQDEIEASWQSEIGTVYGASYDLISGEMSIGYEAVDLGSLSWIAYSNYFVCTTLASKIAIPATNATPADALCSSYLVTDRNSFLSADYRIAVEGGGFIVVYDSRFSSVSDFTAGVSGVQFVYKLKLPVARQLDPITVKTFLGANNIWFDGVQTSAEYSADTKGAFKVETEGLSKAIDRIYNFEGIRFQFIDADSWESGYYNWNQAHTELMKNNGGTTWFCLKLINLQAGTYHFNHFCSVAFSFIEKISDGSITNLADIGVTETANGSVTIAYAFNLWLSIGPAFDKTKTMFANGNLPAAYLYGYYKETSYYVNAQGQTVFIVGEGYIPTIQQACDMASANDIIFIRCGTYTEQVAIWNKKLHLIGEDKANTILIDHSGNYDTPPLEMSLGSLSNLTIIEDGSTPTGTGAYCLHIEWEPPANEVLKVENCDFINYIHAPLGCGLYQDYTVHFKNCSFRCEATNEGNDERGSFFFHTRNAPDCTGQKIIAENCIISSAGAKWAVLLGVPSGANNSGSAEARFSGCTIWTDDDGTADSIAYFDQTGGSDVLSLVNSYGNTVSSLNN